MASSSASKSASHGKKTPAPRKGRSKQSSSLSAAQKRQPKRKREPTPEEYRVRSIVDEDQARYLIDWEDSPGGSQYSPTWEPKENANQAAISDWEEIKRNRIARLSDAQPQPQTQDSPQEQLQSSIREQEAQHNTQLSVPETVLTISTQESQPVREAKRRRVPDTQDSESISINIEESSSRPRKAGSVKTARFSFSQEDDSVTALEEVNEATVADSYQESSLRIDTPYFQVLIEVPPGFDKALYERFSSQGSISLLAVAPEADQPPSTTAPGGGSSTLYRTPHRIPRKTVIPDSQEASSWSVVDISTQGVSQSQNQLEGGSPEYPPLDIPQSSDCLAPDSIARPACAGAKESVPVDQADTEDRKGDSFLSTVQEPGSRGIFDSLSHLRTSSLTETGPVAQYSAPSTEDVFHCEPSSAAGIDNREHLHSHEEHVGPHLHSFEEALVPSPCVTSIEPDRQTDSQAFQTQLSPLQFPQSNFEQALSHLTSLPYHDLVEAQAPPLVENVYLSVESSLSRECPTNLLTLSLPQPSSEAPLNSNGNSWTEEPHSQLRSQDSPLYPQRSPVFQSSPTHVFPDTFASDYPPRPSTPSDMDIPLREDGTPVSMKDRMKQVREAAALAASQSPRATSSSILNRESSPAHVHRQHNDQPEEAVAEPFVTEPSTSVPILGPPVLDTPGIMESVMVAEVNNELGGDDTLSHTDTVGEHALEDVDGNDEEDGDYDDAEDEEEEEELVVLQPQLTSPNSHLVLLPLTSVTRDLYDKIITNNKRSIISIVRGDASDSAHDLASNMLRQLSLLCNHQDLITEESATQLQMTDHDTSRWAQSCSTKCLFLCQLLDQLRGEEKHITVLAGRGRTIDILESILKAEGHDYNRPDQARSVGGQALLQVTLLPTDLESGEFVVGRADAVIAFDTTFRHNDQPYASVLRQSLTDPNELAPLITLAVIKSVEHLELCIPSTSDSRTELKLLTGVTLTRKAAGILGFGQPGPVELAVSVAMFLRETTSEWPLQQEENISGLKIPDFTSRSQTQTTPHTPTAPTTQSLSGSTTQTQDLPAPSLKRSFESEEPEGSRKRKMDANGNFVAMTDISAIPRPLRLSRSVSTQYVGDEQASLKELQEKNSYLKSRCAAFSTENEKLSSANTKLEAALEEQRQAYRVDIISVHKSLKEHAILKNELDKIKLLNEQYVARHQKLMEGKAGLEGQIKTLREEILNAGTQDISELKKRNAAQTDTITSLEHKLAQAKKDQDFFRDSYQRASFETTSLGSQLSQASSQLKDAERRADITKVEVNKVNAAKQHGVFIARIRILEAELSQSKEELIKKEQELKATRNNRRDTRGASMVPGSPRLGIASPRGPRPMGSRSGSPAPGQVGVGVGLGFGSGPGAAFGAPPAFMPGPPGRSQHLREN